MNISVNKTVSMFACEFSNSLSFIVNCAVIGHVLVTVVTSDTMPCVQQHRSGLINGVNQTETQANAVLDRLQNTIYMIYTGVRIA